ncbi:MAG: DUF5810 domain-containing protein [Haloplanus sp.]
MGYACPVCEVPQRDAEHLANHLAFTAMLHGDAHETWLDDHAPDWEAGSAEDLAPVVADAAEDATYEEVFEDTVPAERGRPDVGGVGEGGHDHDHDHAPPGASGAGGSEPLDDDARDVLREAREMTRQMLADDGDETDTEDDADGKA